MNNTCIGFFQKGGKKYIGIFDIQLNSFIWEKPINIGGNKIVHEKILGYQNKKNTNIFTVLDRITGNQIWELDFLNFGFLEEKTRLRRIIGIFDELLIMVIGSFNQTFSEAQLIALEVNTGKTRWHLRKIQDHIASYTHLSHNVGAYIPGLYSMVTNEEGTRLYGLENSSIVEIEVSTGNVLRFRNLGGENARTIHYQNYELGIKNISYYQGHLYFTAFVQGYSLASCLVGAFDLITEEIVWLHDMKFRRAEQFFGASDFPVLDNNRLYISAYDTLYIFERA